MKKLFFSFIIILFNFQIALAVCHVTGSACSIEDVGYSPVVQKKVLKFNKNREKLSSIFNNIVFFKLFFNKKG